MIQGAVLGNIVAFACYNVLKKKPLGKKAMARRKTPAQMPRSALVAVLLVRLYGHPKSTEPQRTARLTGATYGVDCQRQLLSGALCICFWYLGGLAELFDSPQEETKTRGKGSGRECP